MKVFQGVVVSDKMNKAAIVEVKFTKTHPLYKKKLTFKRKIHAQNTLEAKTGQKVKIAECRPVSKTIAFKITEVLK
jgi:small subunit ribosomal protein S17